MSVPVSAALPLIAVDERREWVNVGDPDHRSARFDGLFAAKVKLVRRTFAISAEPAVTSGRLASLRYCAYEAAKSKFSSKYSSLLWDEYDKRAVDADPKSMKKCSLALSAYSSVISA